MVNTVFHSESFLPRRRRNRLMQNIYEVNVYGEDGEYAQFDIMADSNSEAAAEAELLAVDIPNISYITITNMG